MKIIQRVPLLLFFVILLQNYSSAQDKLSLKFGKISTDDFDLSRHRFDSSTGAIFLSDVGTSQFEGNSKGWFSLIHKRHARIKILNKSGFDVANVSIPLYTNGSNEEKLDDLRAATYYMEDGKIVTTKLEEKNIFKDKLSKNLVIKKFTLPAVKEGAIIEFSYTVISDFLFNLQPWSFQGSHPRLWSEYEIKIPEYFRYVFLSQGSSAFSVNERSESKSQFRIIVPGGTSADSHIGLSANVYGNRWVMKNVPAIKEEAFTTSLQNYLSKIEFQLSLIQLPNSIPQNIMGDWKKTNDALLKDEDFGASLTKSNWLDQEMKNITGHTNNANEKTKLIYTFVRDNFTATSTAGKYLSTSLKNTYKSRKGSVADINLLLTAMLKHEDIQADPVILSTRDHGFTHELYPLIDRFNYVVVKVNEGDKTYYLDATQPKLGFNRLPLYCYNGHSRVIGKETIPIYLEADSIRERKATLVTFNYNEEGKYTGRLISTLGYFESLKVREELAEKGKDDLLKKMKQSLPNEVEIKNLQMDSITNLDHPLTIKYQIDIPQIQSEDLIYFNPMLGEGYKDNYFKSAERSYPVEMPFTIDETFIFNMQIPEGYTVDEMPKSTRVTFNENEGSFEYIISKQENSVQLRSKLRLDKANFTAEDYEGLRDFFSHIVKKHSEQIVFKKKK